MLGKNEIKYIQSLGQKKSRLELGQFIAEGPKLAQDLLNEAPQDIVCLYGTESWCKKNDNLPASIQIKQIEPFELEKISALQTPQQVLATVKMRPNVFQPFPQKKWSLVLDGLQDPGNMGSIIRIADWFGISNIYCTADTADCHNPKVVQAAMGSLWRVNISYGPVHQWLQQVAIPVYGTLLNGDTIFNKKPFEPGIVIIGNEGKGIREELMTAITQAITIPRIGHAESLNAAVATGIVMAQLTQPYTPAGGL